MARDCRPGHGLVLRWGSRGAGSSVAWWIAGRAHVRARWRGRDVHRDRGIRHSGRSGRWAHQLRAGLAPVQQPDDPDRRALKAARHRAGVAGLRAPLLEIGKIALAHVAEARTEGTTP